MTNRMQRTARMVGLFVWLSGCVGPTVGSVGLLDPSAYPGTIRAPEEMTHDFLWQQQLVARFGSRTESFSAALQRQGNTLTLVGLTPYGARAFVLALQGSELTFNAPADLKLPFPPRFMMLDVQRAFFPTPGLDVGGDGTRQTEHDGEVIWEQWRDGQLLERRFVRRSGKPAGSITVRYSKWRPDGAGRVAGEVIVINGWFGYELRILTASVELP